MFVNVRPYCFYFLEKIKENFDVYIYTASIKEYAEKVIQNILDPKGEIILKIFDRNHCIKT